MANPQHFGLTGGIGSGKSTVASMLVECGALCVDTDAIARELTKVGGAALPALAEAFGSDLITPEGALDRDRMRALAFADPVQRLRLEGILHPMIGREADRQAQRAGKGPVVFDVPLLGETSQWRQKVSRVLVVDCSESTQLERTMKRSAWPAETVERIMSQQLPRARRRRLADAVIVNDHVSLDELRQEVQALWREWIKP